VPSTPQQEVNNPSYSGEQVLSQEPQRLANRYIVITLCFGAFNNSSHDLVLWCIPLLYTQLEETLKVRGGWRRAKGLPRGVCHSRECCNSFPSFDEDICRECSYPRFTFRRRIYFKTAPTTQRVHAIIGMYGQSLRGLPRLRSSVCTRMARWEEFLTRGYSSPADLPQSRSARRATLTAISTTPAAPS
jgi:hypothetical protein